MELKKNKSALAALATLGVTAIAAGATAFVKLREKRREHEELQEKTDRLTAEQMMVYNDAIKSFLSLNNRIYELRQYRVQLQPLIKWLAMEGDKPQTTSDVADVDKLCADIGRFLTTKVPFINACLNTILQDGSTFSDYVHAGVDGTFDATLAEEPTGICVEEGTPIKYVLKLGYYFPDTALVQHPVKAIVVV